MKTYLPIALMAVICSVAVAATRIEVTQGVKKFADGDSITISEVSSEKGTLTAGDTITVKGTYTLVSQKNALLLLSVTQDTTKPLSNQGATQKTIEAGTGKYEMTHILSAGWLHLGFYNPETGKPFGQLYFGTKEQMDEIANWNLDYVKSEQPEKTFKEEPVNYIVSVQWKEAKGATNLLQVVTAEGEFKLATFQMHPMKINNYDVPVIVILKGRLNVLSPEKGRIYLDLGQKTPIVTGTSMAKGTNAPCQSYQYIDVGLNSNFVVTFGKPLVIQTDENGEVSILVKREESK